MNATQPPDPATGPASGGLDDFEEFVTARYQPLLVALAERRVTGRLVRGGSGHYLLVVGQAPGRPVVEVTDGGQPLPPRPEDVTAWDLVVDRRRVVSLPSSATVEQVADRVCDLLFPTR